MTISHLVGGAHYFMLCYTLAMRFFCCLPMLILFPFNTIQARWAEPSSAPMSVEFSNVFVDVDEDGSFVLTGEIQTELLTEGALAGRSHFSRVFSRANTTAEILEAKTILPKREIRVPKEMIEEKPVASDQEGFNDFVRLSVCFPALEVGAKVYVKFRERYTNRILPGFFSWDENLALGTYLQKGVTRIKAPFPLLIESGNSGDTIEIRRISDREIEIQTRKPYYRQVIDEDSAEVLPESTPWIRIATSKNWSDVFQPLARGLAACPISAWDACAKISITTSSRERNSSESR